MSKYRVWLLLIICNFLWAGNYVFGKYVIVEMSPLWITFSRWFLALFFLFPLAYYIEKPQWGRIRQEWPRLLGMGLFGVICYNVILYSALSYTTPTNAALVSALNPAVLVAFSVFLYKEKLSMWQMVGFFVSLAGVLVVLLNGDVYRLLQLEFNRGDLLMLLAITVWTIYSLLARKLTMPPITATAISTAFAVVLMAPVALTQMIDFTQLSSLTITGIIYMVLFPSVCSFVFWNRAVLEIGVSQAGVFLNLVPVFTAFISIILGQSLSLAQCFGGLLVFSGVYLTTGLLDKKDSGKKQGVTKQSRFKKTDFCQEK